MLCVECETGVMPGVVHTGGAWEGPPVAVVTRRPERATAYLEMAPIGPYVVVEEVRHIPHDRPLGGMALLDAEPLEEGLVHALTAACLRVSGDGDERPGPGRAATSPG